MLEENSEDSFSLKSTEQPIRNIGFICQDSSPALCKKWVTTINSILQTHKDFLKAIESPIAYQKERTREA